MKFKSIILFLVFSINTAIAEPLTFVTTNGAGSLVDTALRYFAPLIEKELGREVIVKNMPGGDGLVAMSYYNSLPQDGNTILAGGTSVSFAYANKKFEPLYEPMMGLAKAEVIITVPGNSSVENIKDLIELSKKRGHISGGSSGIATSLTFAIMDEHIGTNIVPIEYKQSSQIPVDLAQGDLTDFALTGGGQAAIRSFISSGKIKPIAIVGSEPSNYYKDVRTFKQQGYAAITEDFSWCGLFIHTNLSKEVKEKLINSISKAINSEEGKGFETLQGEPKRYTINKKQLSELQKREIDILVKYLPKVKR